MLNVLLIALFKSESEKAYQTRIGEHISAVRKADTKRYETADHCWKFNHDFNWTENKVLGHELNTTIRKIKETIHSIKTKNCINGISCTWLPETKVKHDENTQTENNHQNSPDRVHQGPQFQKPAKNFLMCPHRSEFNTHTISSAKTFARR